MSELPSGTVTFLFTDIEGSTRLLKLLGERYADLLDEQQRLLRAAFAAHDGRVVDTQGDSFFAAFPRARDAVAAAVAAQEALAAHGWPEGVELRVRMGIHAGEPLIGDERYVGLGVHRAARIGAAAHGGQVLVSQTIRSLLRDEPLCDLEWRDLGEFRLKDLDEPERLYQLGGGEFPPLRTLALDRPLLPAGEVPLPGPLVPTPPFPFVGRERELAVLRGALGRAEDGEGGLVLLAAEAGGGKTRLIRELAREAAARGVLVCYGGSDAAVTTPYQPLLEWLAFLLRVGDPDVLRDCVGEGAEQLTRLAPELARLTGRPASVVEVDRYSVQAAVTELVTGLARLQPLLLVADDAHWADGETLQLLRHLARTAPEARLLVLVAYRREESAGELAGALADLARLDATTRVELGGLSMVEVGAFVGASGEAEPAPGLVAAIGELSDGTPLLLCELWRELRESGAVEVVETIRLTRPLAEVRGPRRVGDLVEQRLVRLDAATVALVELAAVAGPQFELRLLAAAAGSELAALGERLDHARRSGMVEELPGPVPSCRFSHELVRRAVYDRVGSVSRALLHLQVGEALERVHAADLDRVVPELAHHFTQAAPVGGAERAVVYNLWAADAAMATSAFPESAARLSGALELGIADPRERVRVQVELAHMLRNTGRAPESEPLVAATIETATELGEQDVLARALVTRCMTDIFNPESDLDGIITIGEEAIETLTDVGDERALAETWRLLGVALGWRGRAADSRAAFEHALAGRGWGAQVWGSIGKQLCNGPDPVDEAIPRCEGVIASIPAARRAQTAGAVTCFLSVLLAMAGRFDEARELVERGARMLDEVDHAGSWVNRDATAAAWTLLGDPARAERELKTKWLRGADFRGAALDRRAMEAACELAMLYCDEGRWDEAEQCLEYGNAAQRPPYFTEEAALRLAARARLTAARGDLTEATALARNGVELAEDSDMLNLQALMRLALAEVRRRSGDDAEAEAAVAAALALYERKGNVAAAARLRAAEATPAPASRQRPSR